MNLHEQNSYWSRRERPLPSRLPSKVTSSKLWGAETIPIRNTIPRQHGEAPSTKATNVTRASLSSNRSRSDANRRKGLIRCVRASWDESAETDLQASGDASPEPKWGFHASGNGITPVEQASNEPRCSFRDLQTCKGGPTTTLGDVLRCPDSCWPVLVLR